MSALPRQKRRLKLWLGLCLIALPAAANETQTSVAVINLPLEVTKVVLTAVPGMSLTGATRKDRDGRTYYDVEGLRPDGSLVEIDVLSENGTYKVVEIQRDIKWEQVPAGARDAALAARAGFKPVRVIESTEDDGSVIYELFAEGKPEKPAIEVRVASGKASVLTEAWIH